MTPMSYLKDHFKKLNKLLGNPVELHKHEPKYVPYWVNEGSSKGVETDFIRIYKTSSKNDTFAFAFNDLNEKNGTITTIWKNTSNNKETYTERIMNFEEFKNSLSDFNKIINILKSSNSLNLDSLKTSVFETFKVGNGEKEKIKIIKQIIKIANSKTKKEKTKISSTKIKKEKKEEEYKIIQKEKSILLKKYRAELNIFELEKQLKEANSKLKIKMKPLNKNFNKIQKDKIDAVREYTHSILNFNKSIQNLIKEQPKSIKNGVQDELILEY